VSRLLENAWPRPATTARAVFGAGVILAACCGLIVGRSPLDGILLAVGLGGVALVIYDLAAGIVVFTLISFAEVLALGGSATAAKGMGALLVLGWLVARMRGSAMPQRALLHRHRAIVGAAVALVAWSAISAAWAQSPSTALGGASRYAQDLLLLPILFAGLISLRHVRWVMAAFAIGALLSFGYGLATGSTVDGTRVFGAGGDPNETAAMLVAAVALALALAGAAAPGSWRRRSWLLLAAACLVGLVETGSRGGLVAFGASAVAGIVLAGRWRGRALVAVALAAVLAGGWFLLLAPSGTRQHLTSSSTTGRSTLWTVAVRAINAHPVAGLGNDNFQQAAKDYLLRPGATTAAGLIVTVPHVAHDLYLETWADTGVVGLGLFVGLILGLLRYALLAVREAERRGMGEASLMARGLAVAIVGMLTAGFFLSDIYSKQLWLALALAPPLLAAIRAKGAPQALAEEQLSRARRMPAVARAR
jgi:O-antigen ligase